VDDHWNTVFEEIFDMFEHTYRQITRSDYALNVKDYHRLRAVKFIEAIDDDIGLININKHWLFNYICYQFSFYDALIGQRVKKNVFSWIFGEKALSRWNNRNKDTWLFYTQEFQQQHSLYFDLCEQFDTTQLDSYEENIKRSYTNDQQRLSKCMLTTTLYNRKSIPCLLCVCKKTCKKVLSENYREVYEQRLIAQ